MKKFQLYNRILHVFGEAQRVYEFKEACSLPDTEQALERLGELMNQSHESCSRLYECSCDELDQLTQICRDAGARGSRLTGNQLFFISYLILHVLSFNLLLFVVKGAGWGGCAVSLIPQHKLQHFLDALAQNYYSKNDKLRSLFATAAFSTKPSQGIAIYLPW